MRRALAIAVGAWWVSGCAVHAPPDRPFARLNPERGATQPLAEGRRHDVVQTVERAETSSLELAEAVSLSSGRATAASEIALARAYQRAGIMDHAAEHFAEAARLDPHESAAWDGLARIWRDWGFPERGLGDAYRAVWAAPLSAAPRNTLGTILQALGNGPAARQQFLRALMIEAGATYAYRNLLTSWRAEPSSRGAAEFHLGVLLFVEGRIGDAAAVLHRLAVDERGSMRRHPPAAAARGPLPGGDRENGGSLERR